MTRKISNLAANAFYAGRNFKLNNTEVCTYMGGLVQLHLHGHTIAQYNKHNARRVMFSLCGWNTTTTRERLRALGIDVHSVKGVPYHEGAAISSNLYYDSGINA